MTEYALHPIAEFAFAVLFAGGFVLILLDAHRHDKRKKDKRVTSRQA